MNLPNCDYCEENGTRERRGRSGVYEYDSVTACEFCGGKIVDGEWQHRCSRCGQDVEPGQLVGLFVPHLCCPCKAEITEMEIKRGRVCGLCRHPWSACCC